MVNYTQLTPYEKEYGHAKKIEVLPPIQHTSTFISKDNDSNRSNFIIINFRSNCI